MEACERKKERERGRDGTRVSRGAKGFQWKCGGLEKSLEQCEIITAPDDIKATLIEPPESLFTGGTPSPAKRM